MKKKDKNKNKDIDKDKVYHIENLTIVSEPQHITKITEKTRVSVYYLRSLLSHEQIYLALKREVNSKYQMLAEKHLQEFEELENKLYFQNDKANPLRGQKLIEVLKKYIVLKENIDKLQIKMIKEMVSIATGSIDNLLKSRNLGKYSMEVRVSLLSNSAFSHSHREDKLDTYLFLEDDQEYDTSIDFNNYDRLKVRNYEYLLKRNRKNLLYIFNKLTTIIFQVSEEEKKKELENLNIKQFSFNKQVTIITWIVGVATICMLFLAFIEYYSE
ncbi:MAG: hypothetical protein ACPGTO_05750 [Polaribacter sp.]